MSLLPLYLKHKLNHNSSLTSSHASITSLFSTFQPHSKVSVGSVILINKKGIDLLHDPLYNKGSGYPIAERDRLSLRGLVPPHVHQRGHVLEIQAARVWARISSMTEPISKYQMLIGLQDRNETLFYYLLKKYIVQLAPIIYTPTVGRACIDFSSSFRRARGMYFSTADRDNMASMVYNHPVEDVQCIVVTDGSRILGLGDLGVNGMGIPIGKLSLYSVAAGFHPSRTLPIVFDAGTNNVTLLGDPLYLGVSHPRLPQAQYLELFDEFMKSIITRWPKALIQFEDFNNENALTLLKRYRDKCLCFNDDIQGTGAMALAGLLGALRVVGKKDEDLGSQKILIVGAGTAGLGVASSIRYGMEKLGLSFDAASANFYLFDDKGLLGSGRKDLAPAQVSFCRKDLQDKLSIEQVVDLVKPSIIMGLSGQPQLFSEAAIRKMASYQDKPIIFPLSNPTDRAECTAEQAFKWTDGRAVFASGSPFEPVKLDNGTMCYPNQANNMFIFPGLGLGAISCLAKGVSDSMLYAAAVSLAANLNPELIRDGRIFPKLEDIRTVSQRIALDVIKQAKVENLNTSEVPEHDDDIMENLIKPNVWEPHYGQLVYPYNK